MNESDILIQIDSPGVALITLNRPAKRNAINLEMWRRLRAIFDDLALRPDIRVVALTGAGGYFSSGADVSEFGEVRDGAAAGAQYERDVDAATEALAAIPKPTVALIEGYCLGGGLALAMGCDFRTAHLSARFSVPAAKLGTVYNLLDCRNLIALVGLINAKKILFGAQEFDAAEALRMGLVDEMAEGSLDDALAGFAAAMAERAPLSIAGSKLMLNALAHGITDSDLEAIDAAFNRALNSEDYAEATRAFSEKRSPVFRGY